MWRGIAATMGTRSAIILVIRAASVQPKPQYHTWFTVAFCNDTILVLTVSTLTYRCGRVR